ncbi:tetratricopeptide repeat protein [Methylococcus geothermalis]|uniref:Sel1 repeat family protein n=1 Tax=Methylococcus geothermalis TaxID=2681310 RepID=A0A858Q4K2_9GAMM|nr:tetratricopeptide repeat protein [Methylococcus geothermalis]QJD28745.1 sel1 repeat family protein [Methylococcus geothermalis]
MKAVERGDYPAALREFKQAAERGDPAAQVNLGNLYMKGLGVEQDYAAAERWYRQAADHGDPIGQGKLGILYYYGLGVDKNTDEAARWFVKAAEQGEPSAAAVLGSMYAEGEGVIRDNVKAYYWYTLAADGGQTDALEARATLVDEMTPGEIGEALQRVGEWREAQLKAAKASAKEGKAAEPASGKGKNRAGGGCARKKSPK